MGKVGSHQATLGQVTSSYIRTGQFHLGKVMSVQICSCELRLIQVTSNHVSMIYKI